MKARFVLVFVGLGLALAAVSWQLWPAKSPGQIAREYSAAASAAGIVDDVSRLETELARTRMRLARLEASGAGVQEAPAPTPPLATSLGDEPAELTDQEGEEVERQFVERVEQAWSEARDQDWASAEEERIRSAAATAIAEMQATGTGGADRNIESLSCHTTICVMMVALESIETSMGFGRAFQGSLRADDIGAAHFRVLKQREDGTYPLEVSMYRRGYSMPGAGELD